MSSVISCTKNDGDDVFSEDIYPIESKTFLDESSLMDPWSIMYHDSLVIIANSKAVPVMEIYNIKGERLGEFLTIGNGPEEVLAIGGLQESDSSVFIFDLFKKTFLEYNLQKLFQPGFKPDSVYNYGRYLYNYQQDSTVLFDKLLYGKNYLVGESKDPRGRLVLLGHNGDLINFIGNYPPNTYHGLSDYGYAQLFSYDFILNNDKSKVALATYSADMLDVIDITDTSNPEFVYSHQDFLPHSLQIFSDKYFSRAMFTQKSQQGYCDIAASDDYVYALYSARKIEEDNYSYGARIRVVSWDGTKKFELQSDIDLRRITVTPGDEIIYAISKDEDDNPIVVTFDINKILNR